MVTKKFHEVYRAGRRRLRRLVFLPNHDGHMLSLRAVLDQLPARAERYAGMQTVDCRRIIGSVDRANDFAVGFLPIRRSMEIRWTSIRDLYLSSSLNESLQLFELGGYYFVQDGNHRVSAARTHTNGYLDAVVQQIESPVQLPPNLCYSSLGMYGAKVAFARRTTLFRYIDEKRFGQGSAETWQRLERQVYHVSRLKLQHLLGYHPDEEEIAHRWDEEIFTPLMHIIRRQALPTLYPNKTDLDILCDILEHRETLSCDASVTEAASRYLARNTQLNPLHVGAHLTRRIWRRLMATPEQERRRFFRLSRILVFRPDARIPEGQCDFYRFLMRQLFVTHFGYIRQKLQRKPLLDQLVCDWHDSLFSPALRLYEREDLTKPFPVVYMRWMKFWQRRILKETKKLGYIRVIDLEDSFKEFLACNPNIKA
ncbi:hypothetical protein [Spirochaeta africana]|uniref:Uncharacterized protein n=1 Tax=Spirochaeta africana (strain ATCC 700263 / DSM 8902 / Z-7692) TaxID=889378 RepID=H9UIK2_SPIAZ|nr:hypothetical protein [Spirochaeta africana]AFG37345.1 hypothetical protein Spiaf_1270 [Spirochaeta africana DSM 8902]